MEAHVLVVEDQESVRETLLRKLTEHGYSAVSAANGQEALTYLSEGGRADVIVLDLMMPVMDGWTFRRAQLDDPRVAGIPVIAVTDVTWRAVLGARPAIAIQKPVNVNLLLKSVRRLCDRLRCTPNG